MYVSGTKSPGCALTNSDNAHSYGIASHPGTPGIVNVLWDYWTEGIARRDEVKNKMALWEQKKAEYTQRATERGKLLQQSKSEKQALNQEFLQIKQLDLFVNL